MTLFEIQVLGLWFELRGLMGWCWGGVTVPVLWLTHRFEVGLHLSEVPLSQREAQTEGLDWRRPGQKNMRVGLVSAVTVADTCKHLFSWTQL